jgi:uncharacterized protein DUF1570
MKHSRRGQVVFALFAALGLLAPAFADRVVTKDGRVVTPKKARVEGAGYHLWFENGEIVLPSKDAVKAVEIEGDMSDYVPQDDNEKKFLEQGFVKYQGKWMSKQAYQDVLAQEFAKSKARADEMALHSNWDSAWSKETKHFVVNSDTSPELLDYYCDLLETYYGLMDDRFGINPSPQLKRTKMTVNIYKNRREFHALNKEGVGGGVAGYFNGYTKDLNFYHDYQEPAISNWVCLHEGTHLLTYLIDPQYIPQIWVNEGVADYFGSAEISRDKKNKLTIRSGELQTDRVLTVQQAIKEGNDVKLEDLFKVSRDSFTAFEYAHAWSFIYFLNQTKYKKGFDKFFKDLYTLRKGIAFEVEAWWDKSGTGKRVPPEEIRRVLLESLGQRDVATLEKEWKGFIAEVPIEGVQARFKRGYRAVVQGGMFPDVKDQQKFMEKLKQNAKQAREDLDAAIAGGIGEPRAYYARAMLLMGSRFFVNRNEDDAAKADLLKAIELDPLNAGYRYAMGSLLAKEAGFSIGGEDENVSSEGGATAATCPEAKPYFGLAVELAPDNESYRARYDRFVAQ